MRSVEKLIAPVVAFGLLASACGGTEEEQLRELAYATELGIESAPVATSVEPIDGPRNEESEQAVTETATEEFEGESTDSLFFSLDRLPAITDRDWPETDEEGVIDLYYYDETGAEEAAGGLPQEYIDTIEASMENQFIAQAMELGFVDELVVHGASEPNGYYDPNSTEIGLEFAEEDSEDAVLYESPIDISMTNVHEVLHAVTETWYLNFEEGIDHSDPVLQSKIDNIRVLCDNYQAAFIRQYEDKNPGAVLDGFTSTLNNMLESPAMEAGAEHEGYAVWLAAQILHVEDLIIATGDVGIANNQGQLPLGQSCGTPYPFSMIEAESRDEGYEYGNYTDQVLMYGESDLTPLRELSNDMYDDSYATLDCFNEELARHDLDPTSKTDWTPHMDANLTELISAGGTIAYFNPSFMQACIDAMDTSSPTYRAIIELFAATLDITRYQSPTHFDLLVNAQPGSGQLISDIFAIADSFDK